MLRHRITYTDLKNCLSVLAETLGVTTTLLENPKKKKGELYLYGLQVRQATNNNGDSELIIYGDNNKRQMYNTMLLYIEAVRKGKELRK